MKLGLRFWTVAALLIAKSQWAVGAQEMSTSTVSLQISDGGFEGRINSQSGEMEFVEPGLDGRPQEIVQRFAPAAITIDGKSRTIGRVLASSLITSGVELVQDAGGTTVAARLCFSSTGVLSYEVTNWNGLHPSEFSVSAPSSADEHFLGFGEKFNSFDQAGRVVHTQTFDQPGEKGDHSYKVVPWFLSTRGYGFHMDSSAENWFDMRSSAPDRYNVRCLGSKLHYNIVGGPRLTDALSRFTAYVGRPPLSPPWVYGTWISSDIWRNGGEVRYAVEKYLKCGIPASVFVFDSPWETAYNNFTWNMKQFGAGGKYEDKLYAGFSGVAEMMTLFRKTGMQVVCWMTPFVNISSKNEHVEGINLGQADNYAAGAAQNYFVRSSPAGPPLVVPWWKGKGSPIDFTNPAAAQWLAGQLSQLVDESKVPTANGVMQPVIGGFKTDDGETANGNNTYIPSTAQYYDGRTGAEMQNGFCVGYHRTVWNVLGSSGTLFARGGFTGTQAYPVGWAGDNEPNFGANGLPGVIVAALSAGMSGYSIWSSDIGGYLDGAASTDPADLFMRWTQFGALSPVMQMHRQIGGERQYPWRYGETALANYVQYARLHSQLFPYIYSYAKQAAETGLPIIRPLVLLNQDDPNTWGIEDEYYFGNELLVAPIRFLDSTSRDVYLPAGTWHDFWTNRTWTGGQYISWTNPDASKLPLFVAEGAIIPMLLNPPQSLCDPNYVNNPAITTADSALQILIYPGKGGRFIMYDGARIESTAYAKGTTITVSGKARKVELKIRDSKPSHVLLNNMPLDEGTNPGWQYDVEGEVLSVRFAHAAGTSTISYTW